jgi:hypothetical protein
MPVPGQRRPVVWSIGREEVCAPVQAHLHLGRIAEITDSVVAVAKPLNAVGRVAQCAGSADKQFVMPARTCRVLADAWLSWDPASRRTVQPWTADWMRGFARCGRNHTRAADLI